MDYRKLYVDFLNTACISLGMNVAHDYDGIESDEDILGYSSSIQKKIDTLQQFKWNIEQEKNHGKINILEQANEIVNNRSEEKERQYGSFDSSMDNMRDIFNSITGLDLSTEHMFIAMISLKFSRESHFHKKDNLLDAAAYIGALDNYIENKIKK